MARLAESVYGPALFINGIRAISPSAQSVRFTDDDGFTVFLNYDVLAHLISVVHHEQSRGRKRPLTLKSFVEGLCSCPREKGKKCHA